MKPPNCNFQAMPVLSDIAAGYVSAPRVRVKIGDFFRFHHAGKDLNLSAGFSLIEVLAALAVTAFVAMTVLPYFGLLLSRWAMGERSVQLQDQWMQATMRLSEDLAEAVPVSLGPTNPQVLAFQLDSSSLSFVRPGLGDNNKTTLQTVSLRIEQSTNGDALYRAAGEFSPDSFPTHGGSATALLSGPFHLSFSTIDHDGHKAVTWPNGPELPVRVVLNAEPVGAGTTLVPIVLPIPARFSPAQALQGDGSINPLVQTPPNGSAPPTGQR